MRIDEHLKLLGHKVTDVVTGSKGVVTSVTFDLYGCVMALVRRGPKEDESSWFDTKRLTVTSKSPVMQQPDFVSVPGPEAHPLMKDRPG